MAPKRIAILGGGISSLTTALELSSTPDWKDNYDITVYQMGWRLGGKGASSRNEKKNYRIEEHGLHVWMGFYENAFAMMRSCYEELGRPVGVPLAAWTDAFKPHSLIVLEENIDDRWTSWAWKLPTNDRTPGDGGGVPTLWDFLRMSVEWLERKFAAELSGALSAKPKASVGVMPPWWKVLLITLGADLDMAGLHFGEVLLTLAKRKASSLPNDPSSHSATDHYILHWLVQRFAMLLHGALDEVKDDARLRHSYILIDIVATVVRGALADGVVFHGLDALDQFELREWLRRHGASELTLNSSTIRSGYDLAFSYVGGDTSRPDMAAGAAVRGIFRMMFTYKGAVLWKMQAGMGETVFVPVYEVLKRRGVKFKFFHRAESLSLSADGRSVEAIRFTQQATLKDWEYDPLISANGYDCWPSGPRYEQLVEGDALRDNAINLESFWSPWPGAGDLTLRRGQDFDEVVLGVPIACLPLICSELLQVSPKWRLMCEKVKTVQTQGLQVWMNKDLAAAGWRLGSPVVCSFVEPLDTWADMTHLLSAEGWPDENRPRQLAYFCGVMPDAVPIPGPDDPDFPGREYEQVRAAAVEYLQNAALNLWPGCCADDDPSRFDWRVLAGEDDVSGSDRFNSQYWRPNIDPSERYVLAVAGSIQYRLRADESGFSNLVLTGDWVRNGFNTPGCIESAVISGRQAARAVSGQDYNIPGERDF